MAPAYPGGRSLIRQALQVGQIPESASDICLASITASTLKQYDSALKLWWDFCQSNKINVSAASVSEVLKFLSFQFEKGSSFSTLNSYRSAIAQILGPNLGQDYRIKRFFRGVYQLRPSQPKYSCTWDAKIVLNFLRGLNNDNISLEYLTYKTCMLIALATGQRVQTIASIELGNIAKSDKGIEIKISKRIKTSGKNKPQPYLILPFFNADQSVCVATCILFYITKTESLRANSTNCSNLLLTFKKPYHNASSQTISRWIKKIMHLSGVDIHKFSSHSTRHAATSAAFRKGVTFDTIRLAAGWSAGSKTFATFYNRPLQNDCNFAQTVLSS